MHLIVSLIQLHTRMRAQATQIAKTVILPALIRAKLRQRGISVKQFIWHH